jgi:hypothetical protein
MITCKYCGEALNADGTCPNKHEFKKMCLNCGFLGDTAADEVSGKKALICTNEENKNAAYEKLMDILKKEANGYEVSKLEIKPVPLKKPELKCPKWELSKAVKEEILNMFV